MAIPQKRIISKADALMVRSNMRRISETTLIDNGKPLSIRKMAEILGTNSANLSRFETGTTSPFRHELVMEYAEVLGIPLHFFYHRHTRRKPNRLEADLLDISNKRIQELAQYQPGSVPSLPQHPMRSYTTRAGLPLRPSCETPMPVLVLV